MPNEPKSYKTFWILFGSIIAFLLTFAVTVAYAIARLSIPSDMAYSTLSAEFAARVVIVAIVGITIISLPLIASFSKDRWMYVKTLPYAYTHRLKSMN